MTNELSARKIPATQSEKTLKPYILAGGHACSIAAAIAVLSFLALAPVARAKGADCHAGIYRLSDGTAVDIAPSEGATLRWRMLDGSTGVLTRDGDGLWTSSLGWTGRPDGKSVRFSDCRGGKMSFDGTTAIRIPLAVTETKFAGNGVSLAGRLVMPTGAAAVPIVVLVHGAEHDSARDDNALQRMLPAEGVGAFVYDKRGTGDSAGQYTQDFNLLADDVIAALHTAKRLAGRRAGRIGYQGGSQAGWVIPIAANREHVDFAIVSFGLAVSVIDEDQQEVEMEMREKGHTAAEIADALKVASAAEKVIASGFTAGLQEFDQVRSTYRDAPWYKDLHGNYTWALLPYSETELRDVGAKYRWGTPFYYDPMPALQKNTTPQLWILGSEDFEAPSAETGRRIRSLIAGQLPFTLAIYPGAEHGMTLFEIDPKTQERLSTRYAAGYFAMLRDFARNGRLEASYGNAEISRWR
jgi:uncharacterized protein